MSDAGIGFGGLQPAAASGTASSEVLDSYEEGSWTPTNTNGGVNVLGSGGAAQGFYTKVGRIVECRFFVRVINTTPPAGDGSNRPTSGDMGGLPFTSSNAITDDSNGAGGGMVTYSNGMGTVDTSIMVNANATTWRFYAGYQQNQLPDNKNAKGTIVYCAA
tara:strand:+ start:56 stop:538 length:483 start_codon:yes stop_codon:yes gene_type:complete